MVLGCLVNKLGEERRNEGLRDRLFFIRAYSSPFLCLVFPCPLSHVCALMSQCPRFSSFWSVQTLVHCRYFWMTRLFLPEVAVWCRRYFGQLKEECG